MTPITPVAALDFSEEIKLRERLIAAGVITPSGLDPEFQSPEHVVAWRARLIKLGLLTPVALRSVRPASQVVIRPKDAVLQ